MTLPLNSRLALTLAAAVAVSGCVTTGTGTTAMAGAAAGGTSVDAAANLERCDEPLGTIAVDDGRAADWYGQFGSATQVTSIEPLLRLAVQQSNCFLISNDVQPTESPAEAAAHRWRQPRAVACEARADRIGG